MPNVIYLVEGKLSLSEHDRKLRTAMVSTQLQVNARNHSMNQRPLWFHTRSSLSSNNYMAWLYFHIRVR